MRTRGRAAFVVATVVALVVLAACQPAQPSSGRRTPVRTVVVLGDSMSFGLYGTTPQVVGPLRERLAARGIAVEVIGFPGENPVDAWPGNAPWDARLFDAVARRDPDMVVIQSTLFPNGEDPNRQAAYREAVRRLFDIGTSRGAHVYTVSHLPPPTPREQREWAIAQTIQSQEAIGRGISAIPLEQWLLRCRRPTVADGWHLTASGQQCHADAVTAAVDQLRSVVK